MKRFKEIIRRGAEVNLICELIMMLNAIFFCWVIMNVMVLASHPNLRRSQSSVVFSDTGKIILVKLFLNLIYASFSVDKLIYEYELKLWEKKLK